MLFLLGRVRGQPTSCRFCGAHLFLGRYIHNHPKISYHRRTQELNICSHEQMFLNSPVAKCLCSVLSSRVSAQKLLATRFQTIRTKVGNRFNSRPRDQPQNHTPCRANWNDAKNCPTCDLDLTSFLSILPFFWTLLFLSPSLLFLLYPFLSASICQPCVLALHI